MGSTKSLAVIIVMLLMPLAILGQGVQKPGQRDLEGRRDPLKGDDRVRRRPMRDTYYQNMRDMQARLNRTMADLKEAMTPKGNWPHNSKHERWGKQWVPDSSVGEVKSEDVVDVVSDLILPVEVEEHNEDGLVCSETSQLRFQIEPKDEVCYYEDIAHGQSVKFSLFVIRGGLFDVRAKITAPNGQEIFNQLIFSNVDDTTKAILSDIVPKGHTFISSQDGLYSFCFDNSMSRWTAKVVDFEVIVGEDLQMLEGADIEEIGPAENLNKQSLIEKERALQDIMHMMRKVEIEQRFTAVMLSARIESEEAKLSRVSFAALSETLVGVLFTVFQFLMVTKWFANVMGGGSRV